ncbi:unnamed protein product [Tilletia controversa]|nr:unnamed protein product [Tilletia controversa]
MAPYSSSVPPSAPQADFLTSSFSPSRPRLPRHPASSPRRGIDSALSVGRGIITPHSIQLLVVPNSDHFTAAKAVLAAVPPRPARVSTDHCPGRAAGLLYEEVFASDLNRTIFTKETKSPSVFPLSRRPSTELGSGAWFYDELSSTTSCLNLSTRGASYGLLHILPRPRPQL